VCGGGVGVCVCCVCVCVCVCACVCVCVCVCVCECECADIWGQAVIILVMPSRLRSEVGSVHAFHHALF